MLGGGAAAVWAESGLFINSLPLRWGERGTSKLLMNAGHCCCCWLSCAESEVTRADPPRNRRRTEGQKTDAGASGKAGSTGQQPQGRRASSSSSSSSKQQAAREPQIGYRQGENRHSQNLKSGSDGEGRSRGGAGLRSYAIVHAMSLRMGWDSTAAPAWGVPGSG